MIEWVLIGGFAIAMYVMLYRYEKKIEKMEQLIKDNKEKIDKNHTKIKDHHERIDTNHERLDKHYNHLEKLWITNPKRKNDQHEH